jgi:cytochrome c-type biogenesis protein CcmH
VIRLLATAAAVTVLAASAPAEGRIRASLPDLETQVMCPSCGEPLSVSQSSQGDREIALMRRLIARGDSPSQIKRALVREFGPAVLALPPARGVNLVVYLVPPGLLLLGVAVVGVLLARWRRRGPEPPAPVPPEQAAAIERELARREW